MNKVVAADVNVIPKIKKINANANPIPPRSPEYPTLLKLCLNERPSWYSKKIRRIVATVIPLQNK